MQAENYRSISIRSHIIKIFERVIRDQIVEYLEVNEILIYVQHDARRERSCLTQYLPHVDKVLNYFLKEQMLM